MIRFSRMMLMLVFAVMASPALAFGLSFDLPRLDFPAPVIQGQSCSDIGAAEKNCADRN